MSNNPTLKSKIQTCSSSALILYSEERGFQHQASEPSVILLLLHSLNPAFNELVYSHKFKKKKKLIVIKNKSSIPYGMLWLIILRYFNLAVM